jgi:DNA-directed RNA polymerase specialized sigma24 family protein
MGQSTNSNPFDFEAYFATMVRNAARDVIERMRPRLKVVPLGEVDEGVPDPDIWIAFALEQEMAEVLDGKERLTIRLHDDEGYTFPEIATGLTIRT